MSEFEFRESSLFPGPLFQNFRNIDWGISDLVSGASVDAYSALVKGNFLLSNHFSSPGIFSMLDGFSIDPGSVDSKSASPPEPRAKCARGWATVYGPTGNRMADGSRYTGSEQAVAVDRSKPVLGSELGDNLVIRNLSTGSVTTQTVRDTGGFGNPSIYRTPDGLPRLVDLTHGAAQRIGAGDMTRVEVCKPVDRFINARSSSENKPVGYLMSKSMK